MISGMALYFREQTPPLERQTPNHNVASQRTAMISGLRGLSAGGASDTLQTNLGGLIGGDNDRDAENEAGC
jgi:hypothetical protein